MNKLRVGVLGATGAVGQNYINLLKDHPWFELSYLAASKESINYGAAVSERGWFMSQEIPNKIKDLKVYDATNINAAKNLCDFVFSALGSNVALKLEHLYASNNVPVVSNASAYRGDALVPMIIPEVNAAHLTIIPLQQKRKHYDKGFIVTKPNCSLQSYMTPLYALIKDGYSLDQVIITTLQAASGAGRPGVPSLDLIDNLIPYIPGEEVKSENEPYKLLGEPCPEGIKDYAGLKISATCTRVPVRDGHTASVNFSFKNQSISIDDLINLWRDFKGLPQTYQLPSAPLKPIIYQDVVNRPQPILDRDQDKGMAVTIGRLRDCPVLDYKFVCLSHNTIRGAAGGAILTAELLTKEGYFDF